MKQLLIELLMGLVLLLTACVGPIQSREPLDAEWQRFQALWNETVALGDLFDRDWAAYQAEWLRAPHDLTSDMGPFTERLQVLNTRRADLVATSTRLFEWLDRLREQDRIFEQERASQARASEANRRIIWGGIAGGLSGFSQGLNALQGPRVPLHPHPLPITCIKTGNIMTCN